MMSDETSDVTEPTTDHVTFGSYLVKAREARGLSLDDLAHQTKIRRAIIEALETNARRDLPEKVFVLGYVRSYAIAVNLNVDDTLRRFSASWVDEAQSIEAGEAKSSGRTLAWLPPAIATIIALLAMWYIVKGI